MSLVAVRPPHAARTWSHLPCPHCSPRHPHLNGASLITAYREVIAHSRLECHTAVVDDSIFPSETTSRIRETVRSTKSDQALAQLQDLIQDVGDLRVALDEFVSKRSVKGVRGVESLARKMNVLGSDKGSGVDLWFALIAAYGRLGRLNSVSRCFKIARSTGTWYGREGDVVYTNQFLHALHSDIQKVFVRFRQFMQEGAVLDTGSFNVLLKSCMKEGDTRRAKMVLSWMSEQRQQPDGITYSTLIKIFSYSNNFDGVLYVMDLMDINGFTPTDEVLSNLLVACGAACQHDTALMIWRDIKRSRGDEGIPISLYESMIISCNQASQRERSLQLLDEMKEHGLLPSVKAYNLALSACRAQPGKRARPIDLINAINIFSEMKVRNVRLDQFTYGQLFEISADANQGQIASWLHKSMEIDNIRPNVIISTSLMKAYIRGGMLDDAMELFRKMIWGPATMKPTGATYRTLAKELRERGHVPEALQVYTAMRKANLAPNNIEFQKLISAAAETAFSSGDARLQQEVAQLCRISSLSTIDLHGTSRYEARAAVLCVLGMIVTEYRERNKEPGPLTIIVGRGEHSQDNKPVLRSVVRTMLVDLLHFNLDDTYDAVEELQPTLRKEGRIVIPSSVLLEWLRGSNKR